MTREPINATPRKRMGAARRARIFLAHGGRCGSCTEKIIGPYEIDHILEVWFGGPDTDANCHPLCLPCHRKKTAERAGVIAHTKRLIKKADPEQRRSKRPIRSRGFDKSKTVKLATRKVVPRRQRSETIAQFAEGSTK